jgi:hypothetical protein
LAARSTSSPGAIDAHERLGFDDLIVQLAPKTTRSLDRLAEALELRAH